MKRSGTLAHFTRAFQFTSVILFENELLFKQRFSFDQATRAHGEIRGGQLHGISVKTSTVQLSPFALYGPSGRQRWPLCLQTAYLESS